MPWAHCFFLPFSSMNLLFIPTFFSPCMSHLTLLCCLSLLPLSPLPFSNHQLSLCYFPPFPDTPLVPLLHFHFKLCLLALCLSLYVSFCVHAWVYYKIKSTGVPGFWTTVITWNKQLSVVIMCFPTFSDSYPIVYFHTDSLSFCRCSYLQGIWISATVEIMLPAIKAFDRENKDKATEPG